jgi:hypothetical protein
VIQSHAVAALLLVPPALLIVGWSYVMTDRAITAQGTYIREKLAPRVQAQLPERPEVFGWETECRSDAHRQRRMRAWLIVHLGMYCLFPLVAIGAVFALDSRPSVVTIVIAGMEIPWVFALAREITRYADLKSDGARPADAGPAVVAPAPAD